VVLHRQQPSDMETNLQSYFDELSRVGDGVRPYYFDAARTGLCPLQGEEDASFSSSRDPPQCAHGDRQGFRRGEYEILLQRQTDSWRRLGRGRRVCSYRRSARTPYRPRCRRGRHTATSTTQRDSEDLPKAVDQIPRRDREPCPDDWARASAEEISYYDSPLGCNRNWQDAQNQECLP